MKKNKRAPYMPQALKDAQKLWKEWQFRTTKMKNIQIINIIGHL